jgi:hypothetical protein
MKFSELERTTAAVSTISRYAPRTSVRISFTASQNDSANRSSGSVDPEIVCGMAHFDPASDGWKSAG